MRAAVLALVLHGCAGTGSLTDAGAQEDAPAASTGDTLTAAPSAGTSASTSATTASAGDAGGAATSSAAPPAASWAQKLAPLLFRDINTLADVAVRLYRDDGTLDEDAATELGRVLWAAKDDDAKRGADGGAPAEAKPTAARVSLRLLQLVVKAAAHFDAHEVQVISSHRGKARKGSRHRSGEAIDFVFPGVPPKKLADLLRTFARVGVGVYIHPRSQFVHLDVREQSYHWIDSSPPGRSWREHALPDPTAAARDAAYEPAQDLPEGAP